MNTIEKLINQHSTNDKNEIMNFLNNKIQSFYFGIDPTASSIHLGHLIGLKMSIELIKAGWRCIILIGGFTGSIGDPTDKMAERAIISNKDINKFSTSIVFDISSVLKEYAITYVNNKDWLENMHLSEYMNYMKHVSVNRKIKMDTFQKRIANEKSLSMLEFIYPDLQSIDFYYLNKNFNCNLQIGGQDQWGNISSGIQFIHKMNGVEVHGITTHLLTIKNSKMGKSTQNAVNLYDNIHLLLNFLYNLPELTKKQLTHIFCDTNNEQYDESILTLLYNNIQAKQMIQEYSLRIINIENLPIQWHAYTNETKLSNILNSIYGISKENAKTLIEQNACYVNDIRINQNSTYETNKYYKLQLTGFMSNYVYIYENINDIPIITTSLNDLISILNYYWYIPKHIIENILLNEECFVNDKAITTNIKLTHNKYIIKCKKYGILHCHIV